MQPDQASTKFQEHPGGSAGVVDLGIGMEFPWKADCEKVRKFGNHTLMHLPKADSRLMSKLLFAIRLLPS